MEGFVGVIGPKGKTKKEDKIMLYRVLLQGHNFDKCMSLLQARKYQKGDGKSLVSIIKALPYHHQTIIFQYNSIAYDSVSMPIIFKTNQVIIGLGE